MPTTANSQSFDNSQENANKTNPNGKSPAISIVIPVYNGAEYIRTSANSVLTQTLDNIELIIVDDASTDDTFKKCQRIAAHDGRVLVLHNDKNLMSAMTRKKGVMSASGEYIMFLDADDWLYPNACEELYNFLQRNNYDIVGFGACVERVNDATEEARRGAANCLVPYEKELFGSQIFKECVGRESLGFSLVNKIYKAKVCRKGFSEIELKLKRGEDIYALAMIAYFAESYIGLPNAHYYHYCFGAGEDGHSSISLEKFDYFCDSYQAIDELHAFLQRQNTTDDFHDAVNSLANTLLRGCIHQFDTYLPDKEKARGAEILFQKWGCLRVSSALVKKYWTNATRLADTIRDAAIFKKSNRPTKYIASYYYSFVGGGIENVQNLLVDLWLSMGYGVILLAEVPPPDDYPIPHGVEVVVIPSSRTNSLDDYLERLRCLDETITNYGFDTIVYHSWLNPALWCDILLLKSHAIKTLVYCHGQFIYWARQLGVAAEDMPKLLSLADGLITLNKLDTLFWLGFSDYVYQTMNPVLVDYSLAPPQLPKEEIILWVGRFAPVKRFDEALRIFKQVLDQRPYSKLVVIGGSEDESVTEHYTRLADEIGVSSAISMMGWLKQEEVSDWYQKARVILSTSESESFMMTLAESKAKGIPCVMYDLPYLSLSEGSQGIVAVEQGDTQGAALAIAELLGNSDHWEKKSVAALKSASLFTEFDYKTFWKQAFSLECSKPDEISCKDYRLVTHSLIDTLSACKHEFAGERAYLATELETVKQENLRISQSYEESISLKVGRTITKFPRFIFRKFRFFANLRK